MLHYFGFSKSARSLMASYLHNRTQIVKINDEKSTPVKLLCGVPQGSILGPLLFTLYTSNFTNVLKFCNYHFYADDVQMYFSFNFSDLAAAVDCINTDLDSLQKLSTDHALKINPKKSVAMIFGKENISVAMNNQVALKIGGSDIPIKTSHKNLGLIIDTSIRFKEHITNKLRNAYSSLKLIYTQRQFLSVEVKKMLCDSLVLSHFNHCDVVYSACLNGVDVRRIQKVQTSCVRLIYGIRKFSRISISEKLKQLKWLNMYNRRRHHMACIFHNILKSNTPPYLHKKLKFRTDVHNLNIRRQTLLTVPKHNKEIYRRSFSYNVAVCINNIFKLDRTFLELSRAAFRFKFKQYLFDAQ